MDEGVCKEDIFKQTGVSIGVQNASLEIKEGEIFVIMGLSGSGKSTLVRLLNRLIEPTLGNIEVDGQDITSLSQQELTRFRRDKISMVFQSFALMPFLNVLDNTAFGLELNGMSKKERYNKALSALKQVGLDAYAHSYPDELSGGMQQRVGLARALANDPDILLMDEAFSALDPLIRTQMQDELLTLQENDKRTIVFISHDLDEAIRIGDRIAIMEHAKVVQVGTPEEIITNPANDYVRSFFQGVNITNVLNAAHIAKKTLPTLIQKEGMGVHSALQYISDYDQQCAFYLKKDKSYLGFITVESLKEQKEKKGSLEAAIVAHPHLEEDAAITDFISDVAHAPFALPVLSKEKKYLGSISKSLLLKVLDEGVEHE